jgi:hypothetical protein
MVSEAEHPEQPILSAKPPKSGLNSGILAAFNG